MPADIPTPTFGLLTLGSIHAKGPPWKYTSVLTAQAVYLLEPGQTDKVMDGTNHRCPCLG